MSSSRHKKSKTQRRNVPAAASSPQVNQGRRAKTLRIAVGIGLLAGVAGLIAFAWSRFGSASSVVSGSPLNILMITLDTTRSDFLGCYGRTPSPSPNLDKLAGDGARFVQCSTCVSVTLPSHASIFTGLYPFTHTLRENGRNSLPPSIDTLAEVMTRKGYQTAAVTGAMVLNHQFGLNQGFATYDDFAGSVKLTNQAERRADEVANLAIERLQRIAAGPFFLWAHFYDPHDPYLSERSTASLRERYADEIAYMDRQIGRLLAELERLGLSERTLVMVVGDHGEGLEDHDEMNHGYFVYQTTLHVPLMMRLPGRITPGTVVEAAVRTIDLSPTIVDLAGAPAMDSAQGQSLAPLIAGKTAAKPVYAESFEGFLQFGYSPLRVLMLDGFKYVHAPKPEIYNLATDPGETRNLMDGEKERAARMREQLLDLITDAPPPPKDRGSVSLSPADRRALESLGYVAPSSDDSLAKTSELDLFEPVGADPKDHKSIVRDYANAQALVNAGRFSEALPVLERVVQSAPKSGRMLAGKAFCLHKLGQPQQAAELYRQAIELEPDQIHLRKMYTGMLIATRQWVEAEQQLKIILPLATDDGDMWFDMGVALASQNRPEEAEPHFKRALELAPKEVRFVHGLGMHYLRQGLQDLAAEQFEKALAIDPKHGPSLRDLARVRERQGS